MTVPHDEEAVEYVCLVVPEGTVGARSHVFVFRLFLASGGEGEHDGDDDAIRDVAVVALAAQAVAVPRGEVRADEA